MGFTWFQPLSTARPPERPLGQGWPSLPPRSSFWVYNRIGRHNSYLTYVPWRCLGICTDSVKSAGAAVVVGQGDARVDYSATQPGELAPRSPGSDATDRANCRAVPYSRVVSCLLLARIIHHKDTKDTKEDRISRSKTLAESVCASPQSMSGCFLFLGIPLCPLCLCGE